MSEFACLATLALLAPLVFAAPSSSGSGSGSGLFEVDLVFPRNDTYAPVHLLPVVFAVQNPFLAAALYTQIEWSAYAYGNLSSNAYSQTADLSYLNSSLNSPYLMSYYFPIENGTEGAWTFRWALGTRNCSATESNPTYMNDQDNIVVFTTKNNAQLPDLETANSADTCAKTENVALNVTGIEHIIDPQPSCAVLGPSPTKGNPCAVTLDQAAASSISAAISVSACEHTQFSCTATPTGKSGSPKRPGPSVLTAAAGLACLVFWAS